MKFFSVTNALMFAVSTFAQNIQIGSPSPGAFLRIGSPFTVEVDKQNSQGPTKSVSVVIALQRCGPDPCPDSDNDEILGGILYQGDYLPTRNLSEPTKPPHQSFTFNLPANETPQKAVIHVSHLYLLGAGPSIFLETKNVSVRLQQHGGDKFKRAGL